LSPKSLSPKSLSPKSLRRFIRKFGRGRKHLDLEDFTKLARDAGEVIATRTTQGIKGTLSAAEAHRMVAEKQVAAVKAYFAFTKHALRGDMSSAHAASFNVFKKAVTSNRRRLQRRPWWQWR
jgi:hypothetical protein